MVNESATPGTTRSKQKAKTRIRILESARDHLEQHGFEATNIRAIAKSAGTSSGSILTHFQDKQDLLHAALFDDLEQRWLKARKRRSKRLEPALLSLANDFFEYYASRPKLSRALLRESLFADSPWKERFAGQVAEVHQFVAGLYRAAQDRGEVPKDTDPAAFGAVFLSFYYFALLAWLQSDHPAPLQLFKTLLRAHLRSKT